MNWLKKMKYSRFNPLRWSWLSILKKVMRAVASPLRKVGEIMVISGSGLLGLKGADATIGGLVSINLNRLDAWWALAVLGIGLLVWTLANLLDSSRNDESK